MNVRPPGAPWRWPDSVGNEARSGFWVVALGVPIGIVAWIAAALIDAVGMPASIGAIVGLAVLSLASAALVERGVVERIDGTHASGPSVTSILVLVFGTLVRAAAITALPTSMWFGVFVATAC